MQLHRIQKTTENIHVSDGMRRIVTFFIIALYKYSYLLTYLLQGVTLRLLVIHFVVVSRHQQTRPFTSDSVTNSP